MDPLTLSALLGSAAITGGASFFGGQAANAQNAALTREGQIMNVDLAQGSQAFNAQQAGVSRDFADQMMQRAEGFNAQQAVQQMGFQGNMQQAAMNFDDVEMSKAMGFNAQQAQLDRQFQQDMSNTAYQRSMASMRAAGLNPILAAGASPASTPSGAQASVGAPSVGVPSGAAGSIGAGGAPSASSGIGSVPVAKMSDVFSPAVSNAMQGAQVAMGVMRQLADIRNVEADTLNKQAGPPGIIPAVRSVLNDMFGGDPVPAVKSVISNLLPPPSPTSAATVSKQMDDLGLGKSNTLPSGAPANIPSLVPGALWDAIKGEIKSWVSPPVSDSAVASPAPYAGKVWSSAELPKQGYLNDQAWKAALTGVMRQ